MKTCLIALIAIATVTTSAMAATSAADFEDLGLPPNSFVNNTPFASGGVQFNNDFTDFGSFTIWSGFAQSSRTDATTPGFGNQYSAIAGSGAGASSAYAVGFLGIVPTITLPDGASPVSIDITNTTYAYLSMRDGDPFAKKFGGASGNDPDFFLLTIKGLDASSAEVGHINFHLADFTSANNAQDYIVNQWTTVDLTALAGAKTLTFALSSSDNGQFGMNTPAYFAVDNVKFVPEPALLGLLAVVLCFRRPGTFETR